MSDTPNTSSKPEASFHGGFGCLIFICGLSVFTGLILWSLYVLVKQNREIDTFASAQIAPTAVVQTQQAELEKIVHKLLTYDQAPIGSPEASLSLSVAELNQMIAGLEILKDYRGVIYIKSIEENGEIHADLCLPMNQLGSKDKRYLIGNGTYLLERDQDKDLLRLILKEVVLPEKTMPEGFAKNLQQWKWLSLYQDKDNWQKTFRESRSIQFAKNQLILSKSR